MNYSPDSFDCNKYNSTDSQGSLDIYRWCRYILIDTQKSSAGWTSRLTFSYAWWTEMNPIQSINFCCSSEIAFSINWTISYNFTLTVHWELHWTVRSLCGCMGLATRSASLNFQFQSAQKQARCSLSHAGPLHWSKFWTWVTWGTRNCLVYLL